MTLIFAGTGRLCSIVAASASVAFALAALRADAAAVGMTP
jgi:hypothetical protein